MKGTTRQTHHRGCLVCRHMVALMCKHPQNKMPVHCLDARAPRQPCGPQGALWEYLNED